MNQILNPQETLTQDKLIQGTLIIIGGHEDKTGDRLILKEVAKLVKGGRLIISTVASHEPEGYFDGYKDAFAALDFHDLEEVYINDRTESADPDKMKSLDDMKGIFFSGGDQLRLCSQIANTIFEERIHALYKSGGVIAGTSAGASSMGEVMMIRGAGDESHRLGNINMAPGLGLINGVIIDQHFAERGRIGRLLGAVALNPRLLGIGIDEDTAIVVQNRQFTVVGSGAVYIVNGAGVTHSNIADGKKAQALSMFNINMHVLAAGDSFDLDLKIPSAKKSR